MAAAGRRPARRRRRRRLPARPGAAVRRGRPHPRGSVRRRLARRARRRARPARPSGRRGRPARPVPLSLLERRRTPRDGERVPVSLPRRNAAVAPAPTARPRPLAGGPRGNRGTDRRRFSKPWRSRSPGSTATDPPRARRLPRSTRRPSFGPIPGFGVRCSGCSTIPGSPGSNGKRSAENPAARRRNPPTRRRIPAISSRPRPPAPARRFRRSPSTKSGRPSGKAGMPTPNAPASPSSRARTPICGETTRPGPCSNSTAVPERPPTSSPSAKAIRSGAERTFFPSTNWTPKTSPPRSSGPDARTTPSASPAPRCSNSALRRTGRSASSARTFRPPRRSTSSPPPPSRFRATRARPQPSLA